MIKNPNKRKIINLSVVLLLCILFIISLILNNKSNNNELLSTTESLVTKQTNIEKNITSKGYTIDKPNIILNPYENSPLTALIIFETKEEISPTITVHGKDKLTTFTKTFDKSKTHYLEVYGLYPNKNNKVTVEYQNTKKTFYIQTEKLPEDFILPTSIKKNESKLTNDLYFYTPSSKGYTCAYDTNGDVRWYLTEEAIWDNTRLKNGHMLVSTERLINNPYYMTGLYEIDLLGKIYNEYSLPGGYHHDYYELPNDNLLVASDNFESGEGTVEDFLVELDRKTGRIVKTFDLKDILPMEEGKSENWTSYDWFHNNSVWYDEKTNSITLSGRHQDAVINIDYKTKKLNWILGDPTGWSKKYQKYFFKPEGKNFEWQWSQHAAMITPEGYVFLFDNGNNKSKIEKEYIKAENSYSRGVMYKIDTKNMTIKQIFEYGKERGSKFYSPYISDVDYLNKNHYLIHSGGIVYVNGKNSNYPAGLTQGDLALNSDTVELKNNQVIFELKLPTNTYRVEKMNPYGNDNYQKQTAQRLGTLGQTKKKLKYGFILNSSKIDENYKKHDIKLTKEEDRLVLNGTFKKSDKVEILLYNKMKINTYKVPISKRAYTALCVDILTKEEKKNGINITKYINSTGLKGKYSLYIKINNKTYNTEKYILF